MLRSLRFFHAGATHTVCRRIPRMPFTLCHYIHMMLMLAIAAADGISLLPLFTLCRLFRCLWFLPRYALLMFCHKVATPLCHAFRRCDAASVIARFDAGARCRQRFFTLCFDAAAYAIDAAFSICHEIQVGQQRSTHHRYGRRHHECHSAISITCYYFSPYMLLITP